MEKHCDIDGSLPGSIGPAPYVKFKIPGVIESKTCLLPLVDSQTWDILSMYKHYRNGLLPYSGGVLEQPNAYLVAMELISDFMPEQKGK